MRTEPFAGAGTFILLTSFLLVGCDKTQDVCAAVDCGHGTCVESEGQASCECSTGYHAEGLTCIEDAANTAPEFTSTPPH